MNSVLRLTHQLEKVHEDNKFTMENMQLFIPEHNTKEIRSNLQKNHG